MMRCIERWLRRAGLALGLSQGFHPKPRMTFPLALAVGIEGLDEVMELELAEVCTAEEVVGRLAPHAPRGVAVRRAEVLRFAKTKPFKVKLPSPFRFLLRNMKVQSSRITSRFFLIAGRIEEANSAKQIMSVTREMGRERKIHPLPAPMSRD